MRKLGQHFLKNRGVLKKIAAAIETKDIKTIVEIGPGHGELTEELIVQNSKIKIVAIEKDRGLVRNLRAKFATDRVEIVEGDALKILPKILSEKSLESGKYIVVGNIPYYITGHLLRIVGELQPRPKQIVLLIQKEVAFRVAAGPPEMNRLSASVQFWGKPEVLFSVPPESFFPPPKVHSAVIKITPRKTTPAASEERYYQAVRILFSQPRKTILNNLSSLLPKERARILLQELSIAPQDRPQDLTLPQIIKISEKLYSVR
jgi:16S rRNA (adenine1518-N6/adenine1519-N6)-dimethyltransferase